MTPWIALGVLLAVAQGRGRVSVTPEPAPVATSQAPATQDRAPSAPVVSRFEGRLLDEWEAPLEGWQIDVKESVAEFWKLGPRISTTARDGGFSFSTDHRHFALVLRSPDGGVAALREDFRLDGSEIVLRLRPEDRPSGYLEGTLLGPRDTVLQDASIAAIDELRTVAGVRCGARFRIGPLAPGEYLLSASAGNWAPLLAAATVEPHATRDIGFLRVEPPGGIEVHLAHPGIQWEPYSVVWTALLRDGLHPAGFVQNGPGVGWGCCGLSAPPTPGLWECLAPGRYLLRTQDGIGVAPDQFVDVISGQTTEVELTLVPATSRLLDVLLPDSDPAIRLRLRVTSKDGAFVWEDRYVNRWGNHFLARVPGLRPGSYLVEAKCPSGAVLEREFEILDLAPVPPITLDMTSPCCSARTSRCGTSSRARASSTSSSSSSAPD